MIAFIDRLACRLSAHRWTRPFVLQGDDTRVVSRYCLRCDATTHVEQDVWSEPTRRQAFVVLELPRPRRTWFGGGDAA